MDELVESGPKQFGFDLGDEGLSKSVEPDREEVRQELNAILAQARGATDASPWDERTLGYHKVVFPQMTNWLPEAEGAQLRSSFADQVARIERLLAA